jgi:hypothetical protein
MPWRVLTSNDVVLGARLTPAEVAALNSAQNSTAGLNNSLDLTVKKFIGAVSAAGYPVNNDGSVPDQLRGDIIAQTVWHWLTGFPKLPQFKTDERKAADAAAQRIFERVCSRTYGAIEAPYGTDITTGNWNSNSKLIMRTQAVPQPGLQMSPTNLAPLYANPNASYDSVPTNSPGIPQTPTGVKALAGNGKVTLAWDPALNAASYSIYRGPSGGQELATPIATGVTATNYQDTGLVNGVAQFYKIQSVNGGLVSGVSLEVTAIPSVNPP